MAVQQHVHLGRSALGRDMHEAEADSVSANVLHERPRFLAIAISLNHENGRSKLAHGLQHGRIADVAQMPDFIRALRQFV